MAKKMTIGAGIALDGEKEFRQAVSGINSDMRVLQSEMKKVSAEFSDNKDSVEALSSKDEVLNKQLEKQKEKVDALRQALENSVNQYGENDTKTDAWKISLNNAEAELSKLTKEIASNKDAMEKAKNPTDDLADEIKDVGTQADKSGKKALDMGDIIKANLISDAIIGGVKALAGAFVSIAGGVADAVTKTIDYGSAISDTAQKTGVGTTALQEYQYAASMCGMETETLEKAMIKSQTSFAKAKDGSSSLQEAYAALGLNINDISNSGDAFDATIKALADMGDTTEANAIASTLFGKSYAELKPLLAEGASGIDDLKNKAEELGIVMSEDAVSNSEALGDTLDTVKQQASGVANTFVSMLLPGISDLATGASKYMSGFSKDIKAANGDMGKIGEVIGKAVGDIAKKIIEKLPEIFEGAKSIAVSLFNGLNENLPQILDTGMQIITGLAKMMIESLPQIIETGLQIIISLAKGIADGLPELIPTIVDTILEIVDTILDNLDEIIDVAIEIIMALTDGLVDALPKLAEKIPEIIIKIIEVLTDHLPDIIKMAIKIVISLAKGLMKAIPELVKAIPDIIKALVEGLAEAVPELQALGKDMLKGLWKGINSLVSWIGEKILGFGGNVVKKITDGIGNVKDVGLNIVKGIWEGINNAKDWVLDKIKGFGKGVLDGIKGVFGIHSPSTVFRDEVGVYLAKGLGEGFVNEMDSITKDISGSIPTDFEVNGVYNMRTSGSFDTSTYNAFASVVSDILVPALQTIGINVKVEADSNGMFKVVKSEAEKFYKRTGLQPFPA